nr:dual specificity protein phosphatase family protein [Oceanococcus sp. HetDA_MAG_MS8]
MATFFDKALNQVLALIGVDLDFNLDPVPERYSEISTTLSLGACPRPEHVQPLKALGLTHVVSALRPSDMPKTAFLEPHFQRLELGLEDHLQQDLLADLPSLFEFIHQAQAADPQGHVLIHCEAGVSRSASLVIAWFMHSQRLSFWEAFRVVQTKRPQVLPNLGFATQLQSFEHSQNSTFSDAPSSLARYMYEVCCVPAELELIQSMLQDHRYDAVQALQVMFAGDIPRVIQGLRRR